MVKIHLQYVLCADGDLCMNPLGILRPPASPDYIFKRILDEEQANYSSESNALKRTMKAYE